jgi:hypothetical protein
MSMQEVVEDIIGPYRSVAIRSSPYQTVLFRDNPCLYRIRP